MTLLSNAKNEFRKSPIIVSCTAGGFIVAILMLSFALKSPSTANISNSIEHSEVFFSIKNLLFCLAYYVFISLSGTSLIRVLSKYYGFTATFLSIPVAVIINFSTYITINILPPTLFSKSQLLQISDSIYWCTLILFVAFCGKAIMSVIVGKPDDDESTNIGDSVGAILVLFFICLLVWGKMVSYGQHSLISSLLPEEWQPITEETVQPTLNKD